MRIYQAARISRTNEVLLTFSIVGAPVSAPRRGRTATRPRAITPDGWGNHAGLPLHGRTERTPQRGHTDTDQQMSTRPRVKAGARIIVQDAAGGNTPRAGLGRKDPHFHAW